MSHLLESYAAGRWFAASDEGAPLLDAATGEEVARISSTGPRPRRDDDVRPHRRRPRPARADLPRARRPAQGDGQAPDEIKDEFHALSLRTGATARRRHGRHRGRHRHGLRFASQGHPRAAQPHRRPRRRPRAAGPRGHLRRPARLHLATRRRQRRRGRRPLRPPRHASPSTGSGAGCGPPPRTVDGALRQLGVRAEGAYLSASRSRSHRARGPRARRPHRAHRDLHGRRPRAHDPHQRRDRPRGRRRRPGSPCTARTPPPCRPDSFPRDGQTVTVLRITGTQEVREEPIPFDDASGPTTPRCSRAPRSSNAPGSPGARRVTYALRTVNGVRQKPRPDRPRRSCASRSASS